MTPDQRIGLIGGIVGGVLGVAGGLVGTYFSLRNTAGPRERAFVMKAAAALWLMLTSCLVAFLLLPPPWREIARGLPFLALALIPWHNRTQFAIRQRESDPQTQPEPPRV